MHLVDTTLFFSPTSGGVRRYLTAKHDWLRANTAHRHTILVPGERDQARARRHQHHRRPPRSRHLQLPAAAVAAPLDPSARGARARPDRGRRCVPSGVVRGARGPAARHPAGGVLPFQPGAARQPALRQRHRPRVHPLPATDLRALRPGVRAEPADVPLPRRAWHPPHRAAAARRRRDDLRARAPHARPAARARARREHAPAGVRRALLRREEHPRAARRAWRSSARPITC